MVIAPNVCPIERREFLSFRNSHKSMAGGGCTICLSNLKSNFLNIIHSQIRDMGGELHPMFVQLLGENF
jgi:hypothetical protein